MHKEFLGPDSPPVWSSPPTGPIITLSGALGRAERSCERVERWSGGYWDFYLDRKDRATNWISPTWPSLQKGKRLTAGKVFFQVVLEVVNNVGIGLEEKQLYHRISVCSLTWPEHNLISINVVSPLCVCGDGAEDLHSFAHSFLNMLWVSVVNSFKTLGEKLFFPRRKRESWKSIIHLQSLLCFQYIFK